MNPIGSVADLVARLRGRFPAGWAGPASTAPVFAALILGMATAHADLYALAQFAGQMIYLQTAQGGWLDTWTYDFFGTTLLRNPGESDGAYFKRAQAALFRSTCTREAVISVVTDLTGAVPTLVEPWRGLDTFALDIDAFALNGPGRLGALNRPYQAMLYVPGVSSATGGLALNISPLNAENYLGTDTSESDTREDIFSALDLVRPIGVTLYVQFM